ncbi:MAG: O-methyltransferase [Bacteroidales bacterium]
MSAIHTSFQWIVHRLLASAPEKATEKQFPDWLFDVLYAPVTTYSVDAALDYKLWLQDRKVKIRVTDYGAGSRKMGSERRVSDMARYASSDIRELVFLARLAYLRQPQRILELGTSLGVSAIAISGAVPKAEMVSVEGCPQTYRFARQHATKYPTSRLSLVNADFSGFMAQNIGQWDMIYIDGNHQQKASLDLVDASLDHLSKDGIVLLDDIHWSCGMSKAWRQIKRKPGLLTVDLFRMGFIIPGYEGHLRCRL